MKTRFSLSRLIGPLRTAPLFVLLAICATVLPAEEPAAPRPLDANFEQSVAEWKMATNRTERMDGAERRFFSHALSSQQVERLAKEITDEDERIEFAVAAYPHVVDPDNFYTVYDAFQTYSKVFRLHDRVAALRQPASIGRAPVNARPEPVDAKELAGILDKLRKQPFDDGKLTEMRLLDASLRGRLTCLQAAEVLKTFTFDDQRLDCAKLALGWVGDPASSRYLVDTMRFLTSRDELKAFIAAQKPARSGLPAR